MATKKEDTAKSEVDDNVENEKTIEAVETTAALPINEQSSDAGSSKYTSMMMALIVAIPTAAIVAYIALPSDLDGLLITDSNLNPTTITANTNSQPQNLVVPAMDNRNQTQQPEWVTEHRAEMEKRRSVFEQQNADAFSAKRAIPEPPQWVKDQQAKMEIEKAKYQEWAKQSADPAYNSAPGYRQQPGNQMPVQQNPGQYYNGGYAYPVNPNQNPPYYPNGPYSAPYGYSPINK